jgi:hypothetical protein
MIAVADTSPLCYLVLISEIDLLPKLFGRVLVPHAVIAELLREDAQEGVRAWASNRPGLRGKKGESVVRRQQESVANFGAGLRCVVVSLLVKIPVCNGSDYVAIFTHRPPVFFKRSSRRRCLSSQ